jgi:hypothetical protein
VKAIVANKARNARSAVLFKLHAVLPHFFYLLLLLGFTPHRCVQAEMEMPNLFCVASGAGLLAGRWLRVICN